MPVFKVQCSKCTSISEFTLPDVPELQDYLSSERRDAYAEGKIDGEEVGAQDALEAIGNGDRPLQELAIALRRRDIAEAERILDAIAEECGAAAIEQVQQGRFSIRARKVA